MVAQNNNIFYYCFCSYLKASKQPRWFSVRTDPLKGQLQRFLRKPLMVFIRPKITAINWTICQLQKINLYGRPWVNKTTSFKKKTGRELKKERNSGYYLGRVVSTKTAVLCNCVLPYNILLMCAYAYLPQGLQKSIHNHTVLIFFDWELIFTYHNIYCM